MNKNKIKKILISLKTPNLKKFDPETNLKLHYRLFIPENYPEITKPLIIYLHGAGERGSDNEKQLGSIFSELIAKRFQKNNASLVVAPQCPLEFEWVDRPASVIPYDHYNQDEVPESEIMKSIVGLITEMIKNYPIDSNRIYIVGFSMGATGVWDITTRYPDLFAAGVPLSGVSDTAKAYLLKNTPIWAFSGELDNIAPARLNQEMVDAVNRHGGKARITIIENGGHGSEGVAFSNHEFSNWLFDQRKSRN